MTLSDRQADFTLRIAKLIISINTGEFDTGDQRLRARLRDVYRDPRAFGSYGTNLIGGSIAPYGHARSEHKRGLAADIIIDVWDEKEQVWRWQKDCEAYRGIGEAWVKSGGTWGGAWSSQDCVHFQE